MKEEEEVEEVVEEYRKRRDEETLLVKIRNMPCGRDVAKEGYNNEEVVCV